MMVSFTGNSNEYEKVFYLKQLFLTAILRKVMRAMR